MQLTGRGFGLWNLLYAGGNRALIARVAQVRTPRPVRRIVKFGDCYAVYDDGGQFVGRICHSDAIPRFGRNEQTVYLKRD